MAPLHSKQFPEEPLDLEIAIFELIKTIPSRNSRYLIIKE